MNEIEIKKNIQRINGTQRCPFLKEMEKFLDSHDHPKLKEEDFNHLNRPITCNEIEVPIVFQKRKVQDLMDSQLNSTRPSKKNYY
jgi:hypothetical protein